MKTTTELTLRRFHVVVEDMRTGKVSKDTITFERRTLNAAQLVGQSSKELIFRHYNRKGFKVLDIGKTDKLNVTLELSELADAAGEV